MSGRRSLVVERDVRPRPRRTALIVPGAEQRMLSKACDLPADQLVLDLEDSVVAERKHSARSEVADWLSSAESRALTRSVRVNSVSSGLTLRDLTAIVPHTGGRLDTVVVPKVSDAGQLAFVDHALTHLEMAADLEAGRIGIEVQLEDASGILELPQIVEVTPRLEVLTYGPGDLAVSLGLPTFTIGGMHPTYPGDHWHHLHMTLLLHARRHGLQAIAGPFVDIRDLDTFEALCQRARGLGFEGTWALHPAQLEVANRCYSLSPSEVKHACDVVAAYDRAQEEGRGAVLLGTEMIDEATYRQALAVAARGAAEDRTAVAPPDRDTAAGGFGEPDISR